MSRVRSALVAGGDERLARAVVASLKANGWIYARATTLDDVWLVLNDVRPAAILVAAATEQEAAAIRSAICRSPITEGIAVVMLARRDGGAVRVEPAAERETHLPLSLDRVLLTAAV